MRKSVLKTARRQALASVEELISLAEKTLDNLEYLGEMCPEVERYIQKDVTLKAFFEQEKCESLTLLAYDYQRDYPKFWSKAKKSGKRKKCIDEKLVRLLGEISNLLSDICKCGIDMQSIDTKYLNDHIELFDVKDILEAFSNLHEKIESLEFTIDETETLHDGFPDFLYDENGNFRFGEM